jgi:hypothetical protein
MSGGQTQFDVNGRMITPRTINQQTQSLAEQYMSGQRRPVGDNDTQFKNLVASGHIDLNRMPGAGGSGGSGYYGGGVGGSGGGGGGGGMDLSKFISDWQAKMDQANAANESRYREILGGYDQRNAEMEGSGTQARADILRRGTERDAAVRSQLTQRGLGNTTVVPTMQMGAQRETEGDVGRLEESLRQQRSGLRKDVLDFKERRTDEGPNYGQLLELMKLSGQGAGSRTGGGTGTGTSGPAGTNSYMSQFYTQTPPSTPNIGMSYGSTESLLRRVPVEDRQAYLYSQNAKNAGSLGGNWSFPVAAQGQGGFRYPDYITSRGY